MVLWICCGRWAKFRTAILPSKEPGHFHQAETLHFMSTLISIRDPKFGRCRKICLLFSLERQEKLPLRSGGMYKCGMMDSNCRDCSWCCRTNTSASALRRSTANFRGSAIRKRDDSSLHRFRIKRWHKAVQHPLSEKNKTKQPKTKNLSKKMLRIPSERL